MISGSSCPGSVRLRLRGLGAHAGQLLFLSPGEQSLGSRDGNCLVLAVRGVSRHHARLVVVGSTLEVEDAASRNGTFVGGQRVERGRLTAGDQLRFGPVEMVLEEVEAGDGELGLVLDPGGHRVLEPTGGDHTFTVSADGSQPAPLYPASLRFPAGFVPGEASTMLHLFQQLAALAAGDLPLLVRGETGVGKEAIARLIHDSSPRRRRPFVAINAAALPAELLEAELFGIGEGVATGVRKRIGRLQQAEGGTVFLDEIGDMPPVLQVKLLRTLQERRIEPLGLPSVAIDVRLVSATQVDLEASMAQGGFRPDLYYRVAGAVLRVPPLRERREDLPRLLETFLSRATGRTGKRLRGVSRRALEALTAYGWPGNVRELEHEAERLAQLCPPGGIIDTSLLDHRLLEPRAALSPTIDAGGLRLEEQVRSAESRTILRALDEVRGSQRQAAKLLGISRNTLARKLAELGLGPAAGSDAEPAAQERRRSGPSTAPREAH